MSMQVYTGEYNKDRPDYVAHPKFSACVKAVQKGLLRGSYINGDLTTFSSLISPLDSKFFDKARCHDFQRLFLRIGVMFSCQDENRYYFDEERANELLKLVREGKRLPAYPGDREARLAELKAAVPPKMRDALLKLVPALPPSEAGVEQVTQVVDAEVAEVSAEVTIPEPLPKSEPPPRTPTLADALVAIEFIESEGVHKGVYMVEQNLIAEIKSALLALREVPTIDPALAEAASKLPAAMSEINELKNELLTTSAMSNALNAQVVTLSAANTSLNDELAELKAKGRQDAHDVLEELKSLPGLLTRALTIAGPVIAAQPEMPPAVVVEAPPFELEKALRQRLDATQGEHDRLKKLFDDRTAGVQKYAEQLEELAERLQQNFSLTPEQITEAHTKKSPEVRALHTAWTEIRETIAKKRNEFELEALEDKLSQLNVLVRSLKTVLKDASTT